MSSFCKIFSWIQRFWLPILLALITTITLVACNIDNFQAKSERVPQSALLPTDAKAIATVRMVQMVTINELWSPMIRLTSEAMGFVKNDSQKLETAHQQVLTTLNFFENLLSDSPYFGSDSQCDSSASRLTLADITAGTFVPQLPSLGIPFDGYPKVRAWTERLMERDSWQKTQASPEVIEACIPQAKALMRAYLT